MYRRLVVSVCLLLTVAGQVTAQNPSAPLGVPATIRLFVDCRGWCDGNFIRNELDFVDHVTEREAADVHALITTRGTGSGGTEYTINFIGLGPFEALVDTSRYTTAPSDTSDEVRRGLVHALKLGLVRYLALTSMRQGIDVRVRPAGDRERKAAQVTTDPWDFWVFRLRGNGDMSGESSTASVRLFGSANASRVTEAWKLGIGTSANYRRSRYDLEEDEGEDYVSVSRDSSASALVVKTIGAHWGAGLRVSTSASTYTNHDRAYRVAPAVEYNVFPYSETTRRQLTFRYAFGAHHFRYRELTLYDKMKETIAGQSLAMNLDMRQPWGTLNVQAEASQYVPDISKNRLSIDGGMEVRLFKGFSLNMGADTSLIRDQIYLPAEDATAEEILLRMRQVATTYTYRFSLGCTYSFGSVYNNVVNSRLSGF